MLSPCAFSQQTQNPSTIAPGAAVGFDYEAARLSRVVTAVRIREKITLDGKLEEPAWSLAIPAANFVQRRPNTGAPSLGRTEIRFLYDDDNLYISALCFDSNPAQITVNSLKKDFPFAESDGITIVIDSLHDRRSGFLFTVNPEGARRDLQISNDGTGNVDWDGVWEVKTSRNSEGWVAEVVTYTANFTTNLRRKLSGNGTYSWGDFYNGRHNQLTGGLNLKPNYHLTINLTYDSNRVNLSDGSFTTNLVGTKLSYGFTPHAFFNAFIQYNADTHQVSSNVRFDLIHHPLSDLFIVYNERRNTLAHQATERAFIVKVTNLFNF